MRCTIVFLLLAALMLAADKISILIDTDIDNTFALAADERIDGIQFYLDPRAGLLLDDLILTRLQLSARSGPSLTTCSSQVGLTRASKAWNMARSS